MKFSLNIKVVLKNYFYFLLNVSHNINKTLRNIFVENLRSTSFGGNKWFIPSILRIIRIFFKNVEVTFLTHILMPVIGYNIRKNLKNWLKEKSKNVDVRSRNVILHHFGHNIICSQKIGFTCLLNRNYMQKIRKKLMQKSWENYSCSHIQPC